MIGFALISAGSSGGWNCPIDLAAKRFKEWWRQLETSKCSCSNFARKASLPMTFFRSHSRWRPRKSWACWTPSTSDGVRWTLRLASVPTNPGWGMRREMMSPAFEVCTKDDLENAAVLLEQHEFR